MEKWVKELLGDSVLSYIMLMNYELDVGVEYVYVWKGNEVFKAGWSRIFKRYRLVNIDRGMFLSIDSKEELREKLLENI